MPRALNEQVAEQVPDHLEPPPAFPSAPVHANTATSSNHVLDDLFASVPVLRETPHIEVANPQTDAQSLKASEGGAQQIYAELFRIAVPEETKPSESELSESKPSENGFESVSDSPRNNSSKTFIAEPRVASSQEVRKLLPPVELKLNRSSDKIWKDWFEAKKDKPFPFQREAWASYLQGESGLVHAPTGTGKTYAVWGGPILEWLRENPAQQAWSKKPEPLRFLWITPLRALANDTLESLQLPIQALKIPWSLELRTGDTKASTRQRQRKQLPTVLVTTPESLSLLLTYDNANELFQSLNGVIVDEWHELLHSKRGVQTQLCLARLRHWRPELKVWGLSATLGNVQHAAQVLHGPGSTSSIRCIAHKVNKKLHMATLVPEKMERFPWAGHLGLKQVPRVIEKIEEKQSTLLFTNTRSQAELWFNALLATKPEWEEDITIHHGSIDKEERLQVEDRLRAGTLKCVVCTGSLDLGVDFSPVEQVIQVGGPKGVARLMQRAGRSGHQPGARSELIAVPANAFELMEFSAAQEAFATKEIEDQLPHEMSLDVLVQHLVTVALGGGFDSEEMFREVKSTFAFRDLKESDWSWAIDFITRGGNALEAYPHFKRVTEENGRYVMRDKRLAQFHRMAIGTISSNSMILVKLLNGKYLGSLEEAFLSRLKHGDIFTFAGRSLELVHIRDMEAVVRLSKKKNKSVPNWVGGQMPMSSQLARGVRRRLHQAKRHEFNDIEMRGLKPVLELQRAWSQIPGLDEFLIELVRTKQGKHAFVYTFAGRLANEGLAALTSFRLSQSMPSTFTFTMNDYGFALTTRNELPTTEKLWRKALSPNDVDKDLLECLNSSELSKRKFREIARIAGLIITGYPGASKSTRQLQASAGLYYDVFCEYEPENLLLDQSKREVLRYQLDSYRIHQVLTELLDMKILLNTLPRLSPMSFPLWAMWTQGQISTESWGDRVRKMLEVLEAEADRDPATQSIEGIDG